MNINLFCNAICPRTFNRKTNVLLFLMLLLGSISKANAQTISTHLEKKITNDLNSLFKSVERENSARTIRIDSTLLDYSKYIMKHLKGFKLSNDNDADNIRYSKLIKKGKKNITAYISFRNNPSNLSQYYFAYYLYYLPKSEVKNFYHKSLKTSFVDKYGTLCEGTDIYTNSLISHYIELADINANPFLFFFPKEFNLNNFREKTYNEQIIFDSLPSLKAYKIIKHDIEKNVKFKLTHSSNDDSYFEINFFELAKKEFYEKHRDGFQSNIELEYLSNIDSLLDEKCKDLNILWARIEILKTASLNNKTKIIQFSIIPYNIYNNRIDEMEKISDILFYLLNETNLNDISIHFNALFKEIKSAVLLKNHYEKVSGNYKITAKKIESSTQVEPFIRGYWQFRISLKACD